MLQDLGIPVEGERGRHGGYKLRPGFKLPPLMFTEDEALALTLGLLAARQLGLTAAAPAVEGALAKVDRVLPVALREQIQAVQATLAFTARPAATPPDSATLLALSSAARRERRIWLRYRSWNGDETEREFDPYGLVCHSGRWYAAGWCHLRQAVRVFRLDRVVETAAREEPFARPPGFDALSHVLNSLATMPYVWSVEALLDTTLEEVRWRVPESYAVIEQAAAGVLLRLQVEALDDAARFLVGLGCRFTVLQPPELRATLRALATEIAATAKRDTSLPSRRSRGVRHYPTKS
jgi:predicted DNA-binding transcriptional regulator YafY